MTTVLAIQHELDVEIAWDSQVTRGTAVDGLGQSKVWANDCGVVFAVAGTTHAMDVIWALDYPEYTGGDARRYLITELLPVIRGAFAEDGAVFDKDDASFDFEMIVVVDGQAWRTDGLLSPVTYESGVYAIGSGTAYAVGAYLAGASAYKAVQVAADVDVYSGGEINLRWASTLIEDAEPEKISAAKISYTHIDVHSPIPTDYVRSSRDIVYTTWNG